MKNLNKMKIAPDMQYEIGQDKVGYFPEWSVKDDSTLYEKVRKLAHRGTFCGFANWEVITYDQFVVNYAQNGAAKAVKDGLYTYTQDSGVYLPWGFTARFAEHKDFSIKQRIIVTNAFRNGNSIICSWHSKNGGLPTFYVNKASSKISINFDLQNTNSVASFTVETSADIPNELVEGDILDTELGWKIGTSVNTFYFKIYKNGVLWKQASRESELFAAEGNQRLTLGNNYAPNSANYNRGIEDLRYVEVILGDELIFSGIKKEVDIIKPSKFTANTTMYCFKQGANIAYADNTNEDADHIPTELYDANGRFVTNKVMGGWHIKTVEGVTTVTYNDNAATYDSTGNITINTENSPLVNPKLPIDALRIDGGGMFDQTDKNGYLSIEDIGINVNKPFRIEFPLTKIASMADGEYAIGHYTNSFISVWANDGGSQIGIYLDNDGTAEYTGTTPQYVTCASIGETVTYFLEYDGVQTYTAGLIKANGTVSSATITSSLKLATTKTCIGRTSQQCIKSNLNKLKAWSNGRLVYQGCLSIPHYKAENNQKVVDVKYRDIVKDLFEQTGYNGYHTIDVGNKNFTLPTHKFDDIIYHQENADGTVAEQRVDMTVEAYGSATNGTDVNLPIEFADGTSYLVGGVTTSSKTATKFTPSSSGTWSARGKGKI